MDEEVKRELKALDRQYSYEHTVQLGRYHKDSEDDDTGLRERSGPKKSVRFDSHDPREAWKEEKRARTWGEQLRRWRSQLRPALSWQSLRMLLVDWLLLAILGIGMALTSMLVDAIVEYLNTFQLTIMQKSGKMENEFLNYLCTYLSWVGYTEVLVLCSATFVHYVAPQAIGSGIPEMKTFLRGVILKDYLTFRTLISKLVGLTFSLGSGVPIGKMGPFVHIASITGNLLSNLAANFDGAYGNECRKSEMLAAACAVGVACCFSAPVGGVLFSIEVTTMYFSVRNYWRGFFAAACGAAVFRVLRVYMNHQVTLVGFYQTSFPIDSFEPQELPLFALVGVLCGFIGAFFIAFYRSVVMFLRQNEMAKRIFQTNWIVYPAVITFVVASITYPRGYGRFLNGRYKFTQTVIDLFSNCTFTKAAYSPTSPHGCSEELLFSWTNHQGYGPYSFITVVALFAVTFLFLSALCTTMPIPCGMFMPLFVCGAAFGRLFGEIISTMFPDGIYYGRTDQPIFPGLYSVVGAAALTGAVSKSMSTAVICCELTGQLMFLIPLMVAVIIANAICNNLQPSVYDAIINIKHLPYLPDIPPSNSAVHVLTADHIMVTPVRFLTRLTTYNEIRNIIVEMPKLHAFPVVDDPTSMMLLGSVPKRTLLEMLNRHIGEVARKQEAERRIKLAIETIDQHFKESLTAKFLEALEDETHRETDSEPASRKASREGGLIMHIPPTERREKVTFDKEVEDRDQQKANGRVEKKNRFTIEPVAPENVRKRQRNASGGSHKQQPQVQRLRRNAFSSASISKDVVSIDSNTSKNRSNDKDTWNHENSLTKNIADYIRHAKRRLFIPKRKDTPESYDLFENERREWELERLAEEVEFDEKMIDPAPFQLVRKTSLYKVHSVFSLLALNRAYVTDRGKLIGVVALRDVRIAIQRAQSGLPVSTPTNMPPILLQHDVDIEGTGVANTEMNSAVKTDANGIGDLIGTQPPRYEASPHVAQTFRQEVEKHRRRNSEDRGRVHDVLTPTLKIVSPSSSSLHQFQHHPLMLLSIAEETDPIIVSRKSSLKSNPSLTETKPVERLSILPTESTITFEPPSSMENDPVAEAVAYITTKSVINLEDLRALEESLIQETATTTSIDDGSLPPTMGLDETLRRK
ncbi:Chloride channel protein 2 [Aphelenchoides besseyi]|nr:Chloride channel protein 2 [Aphelenchoides besseyi]